MRQIPELLFMTNTLETADGNGEFTHLIRNCTLSLLFIMFERNGCNANDTMKDARKEEFNGI